MPSFTIAKSWPCRSRTAAPGRYNGPSGSERCSFTRRGRPFTIGPVTISEFSLIAAMPEAGQLPDMVFRSWTAPARALERGVLAWNIDRVLIAQIAERRLDCQDALRHGEKRFDVFIGEKNHETRVLW